MVDADFAERKRGSWESHRKKIWRKVNRSDLSSLDLWPGWFFGANRWLRPRPRHAREIPSAPGEHRVRRLDIHEVPAHEQTQHRPSEGLGECCDIVQRHTDEGAVTSKPAIGDQEVQRRVQIGQRAVGLDRGHHADREIALAHGVEATRIVVQEGLAAFFPTVQLQLPSLTRLSLLKST